MIVSGKRVLLFGVAAIILSAIVIYAIPSKEVQAAELTNRSLTLQDGASAGGSDPGGVVNHNLQFTIATTGNIGSILFQYCTTASGTCTMPTGLVTTAATYVENTGDQVTGFTLNNTTNGSPYITRTAASATAGNVVNINLNTVTNPTATNTTFFVRVSTYASIDTTGSVTDSGTVAASTANPIQLTGIMPESLIFCTGATVGVTNGIPDCTTATAGNVSFATLFSPTSTSSATSQMAASTNALSGYVITVDGPTLTSGSNTIPAIGGTATTSAIGTGQFGMNVEANTTPAVGTAITPASNGTNYMAAGTAPFATVDNFAFTPNTLNTIAESNNGTGSPAPTDSQIYTTSYIVNVAGHQVAGTYVTTLTYICTPTF